MKLALQAISLSTGPWLITRKELTHPNYQYMHLAKIITVQRNIYRRKSDDFNNIFVLMVPNHNSPLGTLLMDQEKFYSKKWLQVEWLF